MNVKVIGIGNRIMKDDGIGVRIAEDLCDWIKEHGAKVIIGETDAESCFYEIEEDDFLIIIDGTLYGMKPGRVTIEELTSMKPMYKGYSQHNMSIIELLYRNNQINKGYLIGIEVGEIGFGIEFSKEIQQAYDEILEEVRKKIEVILGGIKYA